MPGALAVEGLTELDRAFAQLGRDVKQGLRGELLKAAEPARSAAEQLARGEIPRIGGRWWQMRLGMTSKDVYLAPKSRRRPGGSPRPNLGVLLLTRAMFPAAEQMEPLVAAQLEGWVGRVADAAGL